MQPPPPARALMHELAHDPREAALLLDFDGTLAPIVPRPDQARLAPGAAPVIAALRDRLGLVAFISGRGLADLEARVGIPGLAYAGNHGMEIHHRGAEACPAAEAQVWRPALDAFVAAHAGADVAAARGVEIEDKGMTLSVHWRNAADREAAEAWLHQVRAAQATAAGLRVTWGRMVMEVRPPVRLHKGTAARALVTAAGCRAAVHLGDDHTDADAWDTLHAMHEAGELRTGAGIAAVGGEVPPDLAARADATVPGPAGALECLVYLDAVLREH